jgi:hypothetical protein
MEDHTMQSRILTNCSLAALAGAAMLTLSMVPASAFTLASPSLAQPVASAQIDKVWWRGGWGGGWHRGWGWRGPGWGWRGPGYWGAGYWGPGHCWRGYWGHLHCN